MTTYDAVLGEIPVLGKATDAKPFIDRLVPEYMGANSGKGLSFRWILDHLRDGNGRAVPRSLVWLVEFAAELELGQPRASRSHLLHHVSIRNALDRVSTECVTQARTHELVWLDGLARRLQRDREVPWRRREIMRLLSANFDEPWSASGARPPGAAARSCSTTSWSWVCSALAPTICSTCRTCTSRASIFDARAGSPRSSPPHFARGATPGTVGAAPA